MEGKMAEAELQRLLRFISETCVAVETPKETCWSFSLEEWDLMVADQIREAVINCIRLADQAVSAEQRQSNWQQLRQLAQDLSKRQGLLPLTKNAAAGFLELVVKKQL